MCVGEPTADGYRMLWMEYVRGRRIVDNYCLSKVTTNLGEILCRLLASLFCANLLEGTDLDVVSLVIVTAVSE